MNTAILIPGKEEQPELILPSTIDKRLPNRGTGLYVPEDIAFVNTAEFTKTGRYFMKHGRYTDAPDGHPDYKAFWDLEEHRLLNGMSLPGQLIRDKDGNVSTQEVHITGTHYAYLNYALMKRVKFTEDLRGVVKVTDSQAKAATKFIGFPDFWDGQYHFEKAKAFARSIGMHIIGCKSRRKGFSYFEGMDLALTVNMNSGVLCVAGAYQMDYLVGGNRIMNMAKTYLDHFEMHTDFKRGYLKWDITEEVKLGYVPYGSKVEAGYKSILLPVTFKDTAEPGRGLDGLKLKFEECQSFPNLKAVLKAMIPILGTGAFTTGQFVAWGTGGNPDKDTNWQPFMDVYYAPNEWQCLAFKDLWDDETIDDFSGAGTFYPYFTNLEPFIDKEGNSMVNAAKEFAWEEAEAQKNISKNVNDYIGWKSERALKPKEVFAESSSNFLPDVSDQILRVKGEHAIRYKPRYGWMSEDIGFKDSTSAIPIQDYPLNVHDVTGCITMWQQPYKDKNGNVPSNLYRVWNDPFGIDKDKSTLNLSNSLGVTYVYERPNTFTPTRGGIIVASYIGRPATMEEYDKQLFLLTLYYNGKILFENDRGDVKNNAKRMGVLHLLEKEPNINWDKSLAKKYGRGFGISMNSPQRKETALSKFKEFLEQEFSRNDETGNILYNYHRIYCPFLLDQIQRFSMKKNLDAVSCMLVGMFDLEEIREVPTVLKTQSKPGTGLFERDLF